MVLALLPRGLVSGGRGGGGGGGYHPKLEHSDSTHISKNTEPESTTVANHQCHILPANLFRPDVEMVGGGEEELDVSESALHVWWF